MKRSITGFGVDEQGDWFAVLDCGHPQHVRHKPPFINRPWVTTADGRQSRLGHALECVRCDRLEWPDDVIHAQTTSTFAPHDLQQALAQARTLNERTWLHLIVVQGELTYHMPTLDIERRLDIATTGIIPPRTAFELALQKASSFYFQAYSIPEPPTVTRAVEDRAQYPEPRSKHQENR